MKNPYESDQLLGEYLLFHYGSKEDLMPWMSGPVNGIDFPLRTVSELIDPTTLGMGTHALDLGCAVGRSSFELASHCTKVKGIDYSSSFVEAANALVDEGTLTYFFREEGDLFKEAVASVPSSQRSKVEFEVGDACDLSPALGYFDVVHAANLLCRLPDPKPVAQATARSGETRRTTSFGNAFHLAGRIYFKGKVGWGRVIRRKS